MGKTILELFRSRNESNGEVAEKKYAPRNSKDIGIQTNSFLINNSAVYAVNFARRNFGRRIGETFLEEDGILGIGGVGIRPLYTLSTPILHGTDLLRLETQRTDQTEKMKNAALTSDEGRGEGTVGGSGLLGGGIQKLKTATTSGLEKLGAKFPTDLNPTNYYKCDTFSKITNIQSCYTSALSCIKGDAAGNLAGKILSQPATPGQLVKNSAGAAVSFLKTKARGAILGERSSTPFNSATGYGGGSCTIINYGSSDINLPDPTPPVSNTPTGPTAAALPSISSNLNTPPRIIRDAAGRRYSKTFNLTTSEDSTQDFNICNNIRTGATSRISNASWVDGGGDERAGGLEGLAKKTPKIKLPHITTRVNNEPEVGPNLPAGDERKLGFYSILTNNNRNGETTNIFKESLYVRRGMQNGADIINQSGVFDSNTDAFKLGNDAYNLGWNYDFIPLKINRLSDSKTIYFRSTITGLSETFTPIWDSAKFIGNPFNYYTYSGIERSVSFNLKVYALNGREMVSMWDKLKFLAGLTYPAGYTNTSAVIPPFIKLSLGSFYDRKVGFIESLSYTVDENTPWEVGLNTVNPKPTDTTAPDKGYFFDKVGNRTSVESKLRGPVDKTPLDDYRLPMIVDVQMTVKFVESRINTTNATLYDFGTPVNTTKG